MTPNRIYLDTDGLLDLVTPESSQDRYDLELLSNSLDIGATVFITSELTIVEALVHAVRNEDAKREELLRRFLTPSRFIQLCPVTRDVIEDALRLRVGYNLKTPDAIHIASGVGAGCTEYLTKDERWAKIGLKTLSVFDLMLRLRGS